MPYYSLSMLLACFFVEPCLTFAIFLDVMWQIGMERNDIWGYKYVGVYQNPVGCVLLQVDVG